MKKIIFCTLIIFLCLSARAGERSLWLLHNRLTEEYLCEDGTMTASSDQESAIWTILAAGPEVRIISLKSGRALMDMDATWSYGGFDFPTKESTGWYTLSPTPGRYLFLKDGKPVVGTSDRNADFSAHWTFVRKDSNKIPYTILNDRVQESSFLGEREAIAVSPTEIISDYHGPHNWRLSTDISSFPQFSAKENTLLPALYNMALEESLLDIRPQDGTFMAGKLWTDTWTRDIAYSIYFAYSWLFPDISRKTLEKQTLKNPSEALQDTGSGGSYPVSTDRVVWAIAAWEYYLATGDVDWLKQVYEGLRYTAKKDLHIAYDSEVHLFRGETCSMDWRTHTYPNWFTNAIIGESFSSGTNALHFFLYSFLSKASIILKRPQEEVSLWASVISELKEGINNVFWDERTGLYKCWAYPWFTGYEASERVGAMSNGLIAILGASDSERTHRMIENYPLYAYGAAVLYPSKPEGYAEHNKSVWPVWQTPLIYAAKKDGNYVVADHLINSDVRAAALFLTHKENMTYDTGYDRNTALNSDRQLWSVTSFLSIVYRVFFGMEMSEKGLAFKPYVPKIAGDEISLTNFRYRKAILDIKITGQGSEVVSLKVNGKEKKAGYILPANAKGKYRIEIVLRPSCVSGRAHIVPAGPGACWSPVEPVLRLEQNQVYWTVAPGCQYALIGKGIRIENIHTPYDISSLPDGFYNVLATHVNGFCSDLSNPVLKTSWLGNFEVNVLDRSSSHKDFQVAFTVPENGDYVIWFEGANGCGPHDVYCTIRSIYLDGKDITTAILTAEGDWTLITKSNHLFFQGLLEGKHVLTIGFNPEGMGYDDNMSRGSGKKNENDWYVKQLNVASLGNKKGNR